jgi:iron(III) transport system permease protein
VGWDDWILRAALLLVASFLVVFLVLPLYALLSKSVIAPDGQFVGLTHYAAYFSTPTLFLSIHNSFYIATLSTAVTLALAFGYAYALTHTCMPGREVFRIIAVIPLLAPTLLPALALVHLFGNKGLLKDLLFGHSVYGSIGIVMGMTFAIFPHVFIIVNAGLSLSDGRLYEAAALKAGRWRVFFTVTLPGAKYGLVSAAIAGFTHAFTDFGVPKVIGGQFDVLATDIYKQVIGQHDFEMGAVISVVLLVPALIAFAIDRVAQRGQIAMLTTRAVPFQPRPHPVADVLGFLFCALVAAWIVGLIATAAFASVVKFWPYDLSLTWIHYQFERYAGGGWQAYRNSLAMAAWTAGAGTALVFFGAYLVEKAEAWPNLRRLIQLLALLPLAVPGLVLGLSYIFFFNAPANPLGGLYGTLAILALSTMIHYYSVTHLTALTALKQLDREFEAVSDSLKASRLRTFARVTVPISMPAILDIFMYFFLNAMTTVSAVVFLYSIHTNLASIAVLNMDDAGELAPAAAMAMVIVVTSVAARVIHARLTRVIERRTQAWRVRGQ